MEDVEAGDSVLQLFCLYWQMSRLGTHVGISRREQELGRKMGGKPRSGIMICFETCVTHAVTLSVACPVPRRSLPPPWRVLEIRHLCVALLCRYGVLLRR